MFLTKKHLSRRAVLKGMGATIALPFLDAMTPAVRLRAFGASAGQTRQPSRLVCMEMVHGAAGSSPWGLTQNLWAPAASGRDFDLSPTSLRPLEPFRNHVTIISNTDVPSADPTEAREIGGDHFRSSATYLTQSYPKRTEGADVEAGISLDQLYAQRAGQDTPIPSMQLCIESVDQSGGCGYGYSCVYTDAISWAAPNRPLPMIRDPRVVFDQMYSVFGMGSTPEQRRLRRAEDRSILDWVQQSSKRLERSLGATDRARLSDYLDNVREIERRIQAVEARNGSGEPRELPGAPDGIPDSFADHVKVMFDLQLLAFRSDITRVFSFKLGRDGSNRAFPESGANGAFHIMSHHSENPNRIRDFAKVNAYHVSMLPYLLKALQETPDADGRTMLDNTVVLYGSPMGNPNQHNHKRVPFLIAGHAGGALKGGVHLKAASGTPLSNVMLSLLHSLGLDDLKSFGDSEGTFAWGIIQHAFRMLARSPGLAAVVIVSIGVGIGVNTAVFSWLQAVTVKPLPGVANGASFFTVEPKADTGTFPGISWLEYQDLVPRLGAFDDLLAFRMAPMSVGEPSRTERTYSLLVSGNYFQILGLRPAAGRFLEPREVQRAGGDPVVVISHDYWQTRFGGDPAAVGQRLRVNEHELTITGVAPEGFQGTIMGLQFDLWVPATMAPTLLAGSRELEDRGQRGYSVMGRLRAGATDAQATTEASAAMRDLATAFPQSNAGLGVEIRPYWRSPRGPQQMITAALGILQGVMLLVLLAVCGNTANLTLARATSRQREVGVRLALGAGPGGVIKLLLAENLLLGLLGSALGIVIAWWGTEALRAMPAYGALPVKFQTSVDGMGLLFAVTLGIGSGLLFGAAPAIQLARVDPLRALRAGTKSAGRSAIRDGLMGLQVGLALLVLIVAGLFFQGFVETRETNPGFKAEGLLLATYDLSGTAATADGCGNCVSQFATRLLARLRNVPGIESVALASNLPLDIHGLPLRSFTLEGRAQVQDAPDRALSNTVSNDYFKVMGVPIVAGSDFADMSDTTLGPQVMVNQEFVRRFVSGEVVGRRLDSRGRTFTIAGVVRDSTYETFGEPPTPAMFFAFRDRPSWMAEIHLRAKPGTEVTFAAEIQRAVRELDASLPVYNIRTMTEHVDRNLWLRKIPARMFLVIAPLLLALVSMGIYAVVSYTVAHRTAEIGVRIALGATADRVVSQIVRESMAVIAAGISLAWVLAFMVDLHLFAGGMDDLPMLLGVPVLLLAVAAVACWLPARRATLVDPIAALRSE